MHYVRLWGRVFMLRQHHFDHPVRQASVRLLRRHHVLRFCQGPMLVATYGLGFVAQRAFVRAHFDT